MNYWEHPDWKAAHKARTAAFMALIESSNYVLSMAAEYVAEGGREAPVVREYQYGPQQALRDDLTAAWAHQRAVEARLSDEPQGVLF